MPEHAFFRKAETQKSLQDILFVYCKLNRDIGYRQGMHELLAPFLLVVESDAVQSSTTPLMQTCLDSRYVEHDAFILFNAVMQTAKNYYEVEHIPSHDGQAPQTPIVARSKRIHEHYVQQVDPELAEHLIAIEVLPQIFLIRWVRLLFGREFPFDEVLALWDALFAEDPTLELVDLICVSMLLRVRWQRTSQCPLVR